MENKETPVAILGAGAWGTALALHLARKQQTVQIWDRNANKLHHLRKHREHPSLPSHHLPDNIHIESTLHKALANVRDIIIAVSSDGFREVLKLIQPILHQNHRVAWVTKGFEPHTHGLLHEAVIEVCGNSPIAVLSGPSFANEVAKGLPTAIVVSSNNTDFSNDLMQRFNNTHFRVYSNADMTGVELGGAIKMF